MRHGFLLILVIGLLSASGATLSYGFKTFRSFSVLQSARDLDIPRAASIRPWMTPDDIAAAYAIPSARLLDALDLPADAGSTSLGDLARAENLSSLDYVIKVQTALKLAGYQPPAEAAELADEASDDLVASAEALLINYGLPVLLLVVFFGAFGLPLPSGPAVAVAGAFSAAGQYEPASLFTLLLLSAIAGDLLAYAAGRMMRGKHAAEDIQIPWINAQKWQSASEFMARWGALSILLSRSLLAQISLLISLLAGMQSLALTPYLVYGAIGRVLWLLAYFGLGFVIGTDFSIAIGFLGYLSMLLISMLTSGGLILTIARLRTMTVPVERG